VTGSSDNTAQVWDAETAKEVEVLRGHEDPVTSAAFSSDGRRIVTASGQVFESKDNTARIWDAATAKQVAVLRGHEWRIVFAAFSTDDKRVFTASEDGTARIWDAATGREIKVVRGLPVPRGSFDLCTRFTAFSPNGSHIVIALGDELASRDQTARIWDTATGKEIAVLRHKGHVASAAFSPDGSRIITASRGSTRVGTARIWDTATAKEIVVLPCLGLDSATFSSDGSRVATTSGATVRVWDVRFATMSTRDLVAEACMRRLRGISTLSRDEMRLAGYTDTMPTIDVCKRSE
jgi:WD40 repeat protein